MKILCALLALFVIGLASCSERDESKYSSIASCDLVIILHTVEGDLIDYLAVEKLAYQKEYEAVYPGYTGEFLVSVYGVKIPAELKKDWAVPTQNAQGYMGKITVELRDGKLSSIMGNGIRSPSPITKATLEKVNSAIASGKMQFLERSFISEPKKVIEMVVPEALEVNRFEFVERELVANMKDEVEFSHYYMGTHDGFDFISVRENRYKIPSEQLKLKQTFPVTGHSANWVPMRIHFSHVETKKEN
ncbi:MAG: hypothetical protein ACSHX6_05120 [Akkermansiaceae bacterium]